MHAFTSATVIIMIIRGDCVYSCKNYLHEKFVAIVRPFPS